VADSDEAWRRQYFPPIPRLAPKEAAKVADVLKDIWRALDIASAMVTTAIVALRGQAALHDGDIARMLQHGVLNRLTVPRL
jgi:hypothetical protein